MYPMSQFESGESSILDLFERKEIIGTSNLTLEDIAYLTCRGGCTRSTFQDNDTVLKQAFNYYDAFVKSDISRGDNVSRNQKRAKNIMRSYARNQAFQISVETIICN